MSEHKGAGYSINWASVKIIGQENHLLSHKILVAINIHTQQPAMNHELFGVLKNIIFFAKIFMFHSWPFSNTLPVFYKTQHYSPWLFVKVLFCSQNVWH